MKPAEASNTAKVIAASTILLASDRRTMAQVAPGAAALCTLFLSGCRTDRWLARSAAHPVTRALWRGLERLILPGIIAHYWQRKRWIEQRCRAAIAEGFTRVVVFGAGFDTLGYRLAREFPQCAIIEIDHPATQAVKRRTLITGLGTLPPNFGLMACDLGRESLPLALRNDDNATMAIMEGVLMYLSPVAIDRLFDALHTCSAQRLRVVLSFMTQWPDNRIGFRPYSWLVERWLAWREEPFTWAIAPHAISDFLAARGFRAMEMATTQEFTDEVLGSALEGENLVWCESVAQTRHIKEEGRCDA